MLFYRVKVLSNDWIVMFYNNEVRKDFAIVNDTKLLTHFYEKHKDDIWVGYNSRMYDQYIVKAILSGINPYLMHQYIISGKQGFAYSTKLNRFPLINYDAMQGLDKSLDLVKAFMGEDITSSSLSLSSPRKLSEEEIEKEKKILVVDIHHIAYIFQENISQFNAMMTLVKQFNLPLYDIGRTEANITAKILECEKTERKDESQFIIEDYINFEKYGEVLDFYKSIKGLPTNILYKKGFALHIAGVKHKFGWGGIHGAKEKYYFNVNSNRKCWHIDVTSYYPSYLIAHNRITRSAKKPEKYEWAYKHQIELKKQGRKEERLPFKKMLNALSGAMKDRHNPAYDPRQGNTMVVNCQLSTLMLLEMLEKIKGFELIQSNTDGLIISIPNDSKIEQKMYDVCHQWEDICSTTKARIALDFDEVEWLYQKDVNNYIFKFVGKNKIERKGSYVKELSDFDNNIPILNKALYEALVNDIDVEDTINNCNNLKAFQIIKEISPKFSTINYGDMVLEERCVRAFASKRDSDAGLFKVNVETQKPVKLEGTPMHNFIINGDVNKKKIPWFLDREWYINEAHNRLDAFVSNK